MKGLISWMGFPLKIIQSGSWQRSGIIRSDLFFRVLTCSQTDSRGKCVTPLIYQKIPKSERKRRVKEALEKVELSHRMGHRPTELSGGQQQRVAIARALVTRPSLFLADEPTGNLDSSTGEEIMKLFHELHANGNTIVLITHDNGVADEAERKFFIRDGKVSEVSL